MAQKAEQSTPILSPPPNLYGVPYHLSRNDISRSLVTVSTGSSIKIAYLNCRALHFSISVEYTVPGTSLDVSGTGEVFATAFSSAEGFIEIFSRNCGSRGSCLGGGADVLPGYDLRVAVQELNRTSVTMM